MNAVVFLLNTLFELYTMLVLLRVWLQWSRADFYNPFSQFVVKTTQPVVAPLRRVIPPIGPVDTASVLFALVLTAIKLVVLNLLLGGGMPPLVALLFASAVQLVSTVFQLIIYVIFAGVILSWVAQGYHPVAAAIFQLTEPLLRPIRSILPSMGGLDLSPMILLLGLYFLRMLLQDLTGIAF